MKFKLTLLSNENAGINEHKRYIENLKNEYQAKFTYHIPKQDIIKYIFIEAEERLPDGLMERIFRKYGVSPESLD